MRSGGGERERERAICWLLSFDDPTTTTPIAYTVCWSLIFVSQDNITDRTQQKEEEEEAAGAISCVAATQSRPCITWAAETQPQSFLNTFTFSVVVVVFPIL